MTERALWRAALVGFVVAAATGVAFRAGVLADLPAGLELANVRHAHSHLMYYGWATPALMALIAARLRGRGVTAAARLRAPAAWAVLAGAAAYLPFLLDGYGSTRVAGVALPLSLAASTANALVWCAFGLRYRAATRGLRRDRALRLWDAAVVFLVLSVLGPLGRGAANVLAPADALLGELAVLGFLGYFADGWLLLGVLGLAWAACPGADRLGRHGQRLAVAGLPVSFVLMAPVELVPAGLRTLGAAGDLLLGAGLVLLGAGLARAALRARAHWWLAVLALVGVRAAAEVGIALPAAAAWAQAAGLRVLYLHVLLLGAVSTGLWVAAAAQWPHGPERRLLPWWSAAVAALLAGLVPLSAPWPASGRGVLWVATTTAAAPLLAAAAALVADLRARRHDRREPARGRGRAPSGLVAAEQGLEPRVGGH